MKHETDNTQEARYPEVVVTYDPFCENQDLLESTLEKLEELGLSELNRDRVFNTAQRAMRQTLKSYVQQWVTLEEEQ